MLGFRSVPLVLVLLAAVAAAAEGGGGLLRGSTATRVNGDGDRILQIRGITGPAHGGSSVAADEEEVAEAPPAAAAPAAEEEAPAEAPAAEEDKDVPFWTTGKKVLAINNVAFGKPGASRMRITVKRGDDTEGEKVGAVGAVP